MNLSKKTWHYWLHEHTYEAVVPENLCPYFWRIVFAGIIFIPSTLFHIPYILMLLIMSKINKSTYKHPTSLGEWRAAAGLNTALGFLYCMIAMWFSLKNEILVVFGVAGWAIVILVSFAAFMMYLDEKKEKNLTAYKDRKPNILTGFIKAKYKKMCPMIKWDD